MRDSFYYLQGLFVAYTAIDVSTQFETTTGLLPVTCIYWFFLSYPQYTPICLFDQSKIVDNPIFTCIWSEKNKTLRSYEKILN